MSPESRKPTIAAPGVAAALVAATVLLTTCGASESAPAPSAGGRRLALLVGVQQYANLGEAEDLQGCRNDVELMRRLLLDRLGFSAADVTVLLDEEATGERIRRELRLLGERVRKLPSEGPLPQTLFFFSGHGSQIADQPAGHPDCDEEDGLDETLVPYDARRQGGPEDIRDDELYRFVASVCDQGRARLWVVLDCCHSGTGTRGTTRVRQLLRQVAAVPAGPQGRTIRPKRLPPGAVLLTACRPEEVEPEFRQGHQTYGLLTRALAEVLRRRPAVSRLSYRELRDRVVDCYGRLGVVPSPRPQLEGAAESLAGVVLDAGPAADRKRNLPVQADPLDRSTVRLEAGTLDGVTKGSLFELFRSAEAIEGARGDAGTPPPSSVAWLEIVAVDPLSARASVFRWANGSAPTRIDVGLPGDFRRGVAVERVHQPDSHRLRVRVVRVGRAGTKETILRPGDPAAGKAIGEVLGAAAGKAAAWAEWVGRRPPCDLVLRVQGHKAVLVPATGTITLAPESEAEGAPLAGWGPIELDGPAAAENLQGDLRRIARARRLIRVASAPPSEKPGPPVRLELVRVRLNESLKIDQTSPWPTADEGLPRVARDKLFAFKVSHQGRSGPPVYATVLAVDPDMEIQAVLPYQSGVGLEDHQRLAPGQSRLSLPYRCTRPLGVHWAVLLVTPRPNDLHLMAQPGLPRLRSAGQPSQLEALLWGPELGPSRGSRRPRPKRSAGPSWSARVLRWEAVP